MNPYGVASNSMASFFQENRSPSPSTPFLLLLPSATATASHPSSHSSEKSQQLEDEDQGNARKGISVKVASTAFYSFFYVALLSKTYKRKCAFCSFAVQLQNMYAMTVDNEQYRIVARSIFKLYLQNWKLG